MLSMIYSDMNSFFGFFENLSSLASLKHAHNRLIEKWKHSHCRGKYQVPGHTSLTQEVLEEYVLRATE